MAGFSDVWENLILDHVSGKTALPAIATGYLALTTVAVAETHTGSTITEAAYTGYARKAVAPADMSAASAGATSNSVAQTFAACTAGTSTVIGWAFCSALTAGNVLMFGTCTSTVISTTQTPATIAISALALNQD